jgi:hypothetical protein
MNSHAYCSVYLYSFIEIYNGYALCMNACMYVYAQTPLHGFSMCIDSMLEDSFSKLPEGNTKDHFIQTLEMCKTDCSFMFIAINRTVDFAKSSSNIGEQLYATNLYCSM